MPILTHFSDRIAHFDDGSTVRFPDHCRVEVGKVEIPENCPDRAYGILTTLPNGKIWGTGLVDGEEKEAVVMVRRAMLIAEAKAAQYGVTVPLDMATLMANEVRAVLAREAELDGTTPTTLEELGRASAVQAALGFIRQHEATAATGTKS